VSPTIYASYIKQVWNTATSKTINSVKQIHAIVDDKTAVILESSMRSDLLLDDEDGKVTSLFATMLVQHQAPEGEGLAIPPEPQPTTSTSQPIISKPQTASIQTKTPQTAPPQIEVAVPGAKNHRGTPTQSRSERVLEQPNEPPLSKGQTSRSGEGRTEHTVELTDFAPHIPHDSPLLGGYIPGKKDAQAVEILNLKKRVKKLERQRKSSISHSRRRTYRQVDSSDDDLDGEDESKQGRNQDKTKPIVSTVSALVTTAGVTISTAEPRTPPTTTTIFDDEDVTMAMAQTLIKMKEHKAKEKRVAITDVEDSSRTTRPVRSITTLKPLPTIDPKDKRKGVLVEEPKKSEKVKRRDQGDLQLQADAELAQLLHQEELTQLQKRIQDFIPMDSEKKDDSSSKPAGGNRRKTLARKRTSEKQSKQSAKRQKLEHAAEEQESADRDDEASTYYEQEKEELRLSLKIILNDDSEEYYEPLSKKFPIVSWEYQLLGRMEGKDMEKRFQDHPFKGHDLLLWGDLRMTFDPDENNEVWMNQLDWKVLRWKLHENCRVHTLFLDGTSMEINMLVEKKYPLFKKLLEKMLNLQLEAEEESTMAFELIKFIKSLLEK
nr:hypothetical protein [Tanacetum cinerariifolium]